ncbi:MAG TPA: nitroreductase/quinone reductase family protein [Acidimicrobiales bacterium]|nr:nitroreductase/quinone reductase family protein [Acidimicrobiales bacterium]
MSTAPASRPPLGRQVQARAMKVANVPMRVLLGLPVATPLGKRLMLATIVGRRSGRIYHQPLSYVDVGDGVLLTPGGGRWKLNLSLDQPVTLRIRGRDVQARPELIGDPEEVDRLLAVMAEVNPAVNSFVRIPRGPDGHLDRDKLAAALRYGFRVVRWRTE